MNLRYLLVTSSIFALFSLHYPATAGTTIEQEIKSFNNGNFSEAAQFGSELILLNPKDSKARYYYAAALMKLNRFDDAREQYAECYRTTNDSTMKSYCYQALQAKTAVRSLPPGGTVSIDSAIEGSNSSTNCDRAIKARKVQIMSDGVKEIEFHRKQAQDRIQKAKERAKDQMEGIPPYFERPLSIISGGWLRTHISQVENPDYKPAYDRSQKELADAIEVINRDLARRDAEITAECKKKAELYDQVPAAFRSQQKPGISQIQMTPQNTSGYVRNFVNYDGSAPVGLKPRQGTLPQRSLTAPLSSISSKSPARNRK